MDGNTNTNNANGNITTAQTHNNDPHTSNSMSIHVDRFGKNVSDVRYNIIDDGSNEGLDAEHSSIQSLNPNNTNMYTNAIDGAEHNGNNENDRLLQIHGQVDITNDTQLDGIVNNTKHMKHKNQNKPNISQGSAHHSEHIGIMQQMPTSIPRRSNRVRSKPIAYWDASAVEAYNRKHTNVAQVIYDSDIVSNGIMCENTNEVAMVGVSNNSNSNSNDQDKYDDDEVSDYNHGNVIDNINNDNNDNENNVNLNINDEPNTYTQAILSDNRIQWEKAMQDEYDSIQSCGTWSLVKLPLLLVYIYICMYV
jgi:hypothetical protein